MPIRVNLKEIFPSDPQEINVDKVNFNFNKLLELGVGSPGPIGLTGPIGPAGPVGLVGPQGDRGATWWVDSGDPNTLTFTGLIDGDLYLDQTSTAFEVYQYDDATSTWNSVVSIAAIVNAYLATASPSPFTTGPTGIVPSTSTKFVVFDTDGLTNIDYISDGIRGQLNTSNNKTLFLTNFDENIITPSKPLIWPANQNSLYTSLFKVFANHSDNKISTFADLGRYHLELGSLYNNGTNTLLSELKHNLKGKFYKRYIGLGSGELPLTNDWINTAKFSLSTPEPFTLTQVDQNGEFEFVVPKYNNEGSLVREEIYVRIGSAEAFEERTNKAAILADGISITNNQVSRSMVVGLREDLGAVLDLPYSSTNFALFDVSDDVDGLFFNKTLVQTGGNFDQLITTPLTVLDTDLSITSITTGHYMNQGIIVSSNTVFISSGAGNTAASSSNGLIVRYDISKPNTLSKINEIAGNRSNSSLSGPFGSDQHGHRYLNNTSPINPTIGLIKDISDFGKYFVGVLGDSPSGSFYNFIIGEIDSQLNNLLVTTYTNLTETLDGYRVQVNGKYAWVITNKTTVVGPQLSSGTPTYARLTAVDISDPGSPIVSDSYLETQPGTKYLDFKIANNKAYVLRYTNYVDTVTSANSIHSLDLLTFDILDPINFSALNIDKYVFPAGITNIAYSPADVQNLETLTVNTTRIEYGGLEVNGNDVYVCWENKMYIINASTSSTLVSTTTLSSSTVYANDIKVAGNYVYTLVNYPSDSKGAVQVYDIRNTSLPVLCSETKETSLRNSSRLAIHGKHIYIVSSTTGSKASLVALDLHGISSPSAEIGSLLTSDLHIANSAVVRNNLHVKNSLNVGPGGIYIDNGLGLTTDGPVVSNMSTDSSTNNISGGFTLLANSISQSAATSGNMNLATNVLQDINIYDSLNLSTTYLVNNGSTKNIRGGFVGSQILRLLGTQYYGSSSAPLPNAFIGNQILLGYLGSTDRVYGDFIGNNIDLGAGFQLQANQAYGYKFNFSGSSTGTVYGLHIKGADTNLLEGETSLHNTSISTPDFRFANGQLYNLTKSLHRTPTTDPTGGVVYANAGELALASGEFSYSTGGGTFTGTWIKVGCVVHVSAQWVNTSDIFYLPVQAVGTATVSKVLGVAVRDGSGSGGQAWRIVYSSADSGKLYSDGYTAPTGQEWCLEFSYIIK